MKKTARKTGPRRLSGLTWFFVAPQAAYTAVEIGWIFDWDPRETEMQIRIAVRLGQLNPFRQRTVNLFSREEVIKLIENEHPATPEEMASLIVMGGYRDACVPAVLFVRMLRAAAAGKIVYALFVADQRENENTRFRDEPAIGSIPNPKYPPPHTPRVGSARPDLSNELPHLRTRIRRWSAPKRPTGTKGSL